MHDKWEPLPPMLTKRIDFGAAVVGQYIYVVGGHDGNAPLASMEKFDVHSQQWTTCTPMKNARTGW